MNDDIRKAINGLEAMLHEQTKLQRAALSDISGSLQQIAEAISVYVEEHTEDD